MKHINKSIDVLGELWEVREGGKQDYFIERAIVCLPCEVLGGSGRCEC